MRGVQGAPQSQDRAPQRCAHRGFGLLTGQEPREVRGESGIASNVANIVSTAVICNRAKRCTHSHYAAEVSVEIVVVEDEVVEKDSAIARDTQFQALIGTMAT